MGTEKIWFRLVRLKKKKNSSVRRAAACSHGCAIDPPPPHPPMAAASSICRRRALPWPPHRRSAVAALTHGRAPPSRRSPNTVANKRDQPCKTWLDYHFLSRGVISTRGISFKWDLVYQMVVPQVILNFK